MTTLLSKTLAQIVNENHRTAYVFEKYQLDFCCKGKRLLQQACEEGQIPVSEVISELENITRDSQVSVDFNQMSLTQLVAYIVLTHHAYVKKEMPLIHSYLEKVASKHGERHPEMVAVYNTFSELVEDMTAHMHEEEIIVFPRIRTAEFCSDGNSEVHLNRSDLQLPIKVMEQQHESAGEVLSKIRALTGNYNLPGDACTTYRLAFAALQAFELDLHQHVHLENNVLFPKAMRLFNTFTATGRQ
jgi:regulator of cell morphogenesis and NO signaling